MPYLTDERKAELDGGLAPTTPGDLTYVLTAEVDRWLAAHGGLRYADLATALGCVEATKLELYRRVVGPYEDGKIEANGDVYTVNPVDDHRPSPAPEAVEAEREAVLASTGAAGNHAVVRCDGGGQAPGPVSWAAIVDMDGAHVRTGHTDAGTNNTAEYNALLAGLDLAYELGATHVTAYSDSQLIVNQVNGAWKAKDTALKQLHREAHKAMRKFEHVTVQWVPRESNREADALATATLGEARA